MYITCLDMEGVLVPEIWIAFAEASGIPELKRTTRDEPDYDKLMRYRLDILKEHHLGLKEIQATIAKIDPLPGARAFLDKLREEEQELRCACVSGRDPREELGDLMFAAVGVCYQLGVDPEEVLHEACEKFTDRFGAMERLAGDTALDTLPRERLLELWNEAKTGADGE